MRWPIRFQWLVPFGTILVVAVTVTSVSSAWLAARRNTAVTIEQMNRVIETLRNSRFPFSVNVLEQMRGLSGAEFAAFDQQGRLLATTFPGEQISAETLLDIEQRGSIERLSDVSTTVINGRNYFASQITHLQPSTHTDALVVLYPEARWQQARSDAILPPLLVGGTTLGLMFVVSAWLAGRMSRRIHKMREQVAAIADGDFRQLPLESRNDEMQDLSRSVNQMSRQLREMRETIRQTEQTRLLGQLAGGLAHQLRNAITGARMAIQIHARRCSLAGDDSLDVALRQLQLTEEQIRGLLSLGKTERRTPIRREVRTLIDEIALLIGPVCNHAGVTFHQEMHFEADHTPENTFVGDAEQVRTALLNLVLNAIEAAGSGGKVLLKVQLDGGKLVFEVLDTGPGPPPELGDRIFDVFITGKPEGVGFGLALAHRVALDQQGELNWTRDNDRTCFRMELPAEF
ncbi:MAG: HAMP domain-containing histidine kinase [Planctomycetaceae bacterium]|nr:HAMP domain-containing histidine kinase [Planctomycetaceae bacterium]